MAHAFRRIASKFAVGRGLKTYQGHVMASQDAIYFICPSGILAAMQSLTNFLLFPAGAALGGLGKAIRDSAEVIRIELEQLPVEITDDPDWPTTYGKQTVYILPKRAVQNLEYPWWGHLTIKTNSDRFQVIPVFFFRSRILKALRDFGWTI